jgi:hypothetical protein
MRICITTDRLPQPDRQRGALLDVSDAKGASLIAQGFARAVEDAKPAAAPAAAPVGRRVRTVAAQ